MLSNVASGATLSGLVFAMTDLNKDGARWPRSGPRRTGIIEVAMKTAVLILTLVAALIPGSARADEPCAETPRKVSVHGLTVRIYSRGNGWYGGIDPQTGLDYIYAIQPVDGSAGTYCRRIYLVQTPDGEVLLASQFIQSDGVNSYDDLDYRIDYMRLDAPNGDRLILRDGRFPSNRSDPDGPFRSGTVEFEAYDEDGGFFQLTPFDRTIRTETSYRSFREWQVSYVPGSEVSTAESGARLRHFIENYRGYWKAITGIDAFRGQFVPK